MQSKIRNVLFDLDGTLLDTAPDLALALNIVLQQKQRAPIPFAQIRPYSSAGTRALLQLGFQITEQNEQYDVLRSQFLAAYHQNLNVHTTLFPGIQEVLAYLDQQDIPWGVVTNKPSHLAQKLLEDFNLAARCSCIIGADMLGIRKPNPDPLLYACEIMGWATQHCIYIGDAARDIEAARRANMTSMAALYGYIHDAEDPLRWKADYYIQEPLEILRFFPLSQVAYS